MWEYSKVYFSVKRKKKAATYLMPSLHLIDYIVVLIGLMLSSTKQVQYVAAK